MYIPHVPVLMGMVVCAFWLGWRSGQWWAEKYPNKRQREGSALGLYALLNKKIDEMVGARSTSDSDWKNFLPVVRYADEVIAKQLISTTRPSLSERVLQYIDNNTQPKAT